ncbi:MAG: hypothetical protein KatS3mg091_056 [Patescibacteria group bacterium]|nr:MAG: hypothetical protein KatS3mg091_056 [Patescibacteria group bacterium]
MGKFGINKSAKKINKAWIRTNSGTHYLFAYHFLQKEPNVFRALEILKLNYSTMPKLSLLFLKSYREKIPSETKKVNKIKKLNKVLNKLKKEARYWEYLATIEQ